MQKGLMQTHDFIGLTANFPGYNLPLGNVAKKARNSPLTSPLLWASRKLMVPTDRRGEEWFLNSILGFSLILLLILQWELFIKPTAKRNFSSSFRGSQVILSQLFWREVGKEKASQWVLVTGNWIPGRILGTFGKPLHAVRGIQGPASHLCLPRKLSSGFCLKQHRKITTDFFC